MQGGVTPAPDKLQFRHDAAMLGISQELYDKLFPGETNVDLLDCSVLTSSTSAVREEGVDEIRVHAPGFRFNHDLVIIDTPGLDAYGLDQHKEVTMKLVLPTVDMILFLTNVKCDSDAANLGFIDNVTTDSKPLVIVQNKIDSIEPKITKNGIEKTVEEVKHDHLVRIQRLVSNAKKESVRNAPIVQVSAKAPTWWQASSSDFSFEKSIFSSIFQPSLSAFKLRRIASKSFCCSSLASSNRRIIIGKKWAVCILKLSPRPY